MDKNALAPFLVQQACASGQSLLKVQQFAREAGISLNDDEEFIITLNQLKQAFPELGSEMETVMREAINSGTPNKSPILTIPHNPVAPTNSIIPNVATGEDVFRQLKAAVRDGTAREQFPVGTLIQDTWTDVKTGLAYDMPLRIVDYRKMMIDGLLRNTATLLRQYVLPKERIFDDSTTDYCIAQIRSYLRGHYAQGCSKELLEVAVTSNITVNSERLKDQFFLPAPEELGVIIPGLNDYSQCAKWEYFRDTPESWDSYCEKRIFTTPDDSRRYVWLRSRYNSSLVCYVSTLGRAYSNPPSNSYSVLAACKIA